MNFVWRWWPLSFQPVLLPSQSAWASPFVAACTPTTHVQVVCTKTSASHGTPSPNDVCIGEGAHVSDPTGRLDSLGRSMVASTLSTRRRLTV
jgi:hypothetical protein